MSDHTKEPWIQNHDDVCAGQPFNVLATCSWDGAGDAEFDGEANARRIVACVNACTGIENDELEQVQYAYLLESIKLARSAIWDADNLANYSEKLLLAINRVDGAKERVDAAQDSPEKQLFAEKELREAEEFRSEYWNAVKSMVYEYSKRAQRFKDSLDTSINSNFADLNAKNEKLLNALKACADAGEGECDEAWQKAMATARKVISEAEAV